MGGRHDWNLKMSLQLGTNNCKEPNFVWSIRWEREHEVFLIRCSMHALGSLCYRCKIECSLTPTLHKPGLVNLWWFSKRSSGKGYSWITLYKMPLTNHCWLTKKRFMQPWHCVRSHHTSTTTTNQQVSTITGKNCSVDFVLGFCFVLCFWGGCLIFLKITAVIVWLSYQ